MESMPGALVKDLLSTGYFYQELRDYTVSKEIDLASYIKIYTIPYLSHLLEEHRKSGQIDRTQILTLVIDHLRNFNDEKLPESILKLKKITATEIDSNEKALHQDDQNDRSRRSCHRKSESAQALSKLLVSIIKMFKLVEPVTNKKTEPAVGDLTKDTQEMVMPAK